MNPTTTQEGTMHRNYAAEVLAEQLERGPYEDEDFFRLKVTGNGETKWVNITPGQLRSLIAAVEATPRPI